MQEFLFSLIVCSSAILATIIFSSIDDLTVVAYGILISICMVGGSIWAASFSKRAQKEQFRDRFLVVLAGWGAGLASMSMIAFIILCLFLPNIIMSTKEGNGILPFILAYGLGSLMAIPAIRMERRWKKDNKGAKEEGNTSALL